MGDFAREGRAAARSKRHRWSGLDWMRRRREHAGTVSLRLLLGVRVVYRMNVLGIDIGGSAIKGAPVDTDTGRLLAKRRRIKMPDRWPPKRVAAAVAGLAQHFHWRGRIGVGFPGVVVPCEFGRLPWKGKSAEKRVAASVRDRKDLAWRKWGARLRRYVAVLERILWPEMIIIGGGVSAKHRKFFRYVRSRARLVPARFLNEAGIVGAARWGAGALPQPMSRTRPMSRVQKRR